MFKSCKGYRMVDMSVLLRKLLRELLELVLDLLRKVLSARYLL